jgi:hypothetical protein
MPAAPQAQIWNELFRLGLTKRLVKQRLGLGIKASGRLWSQPLNVLTIPQIQTLCALVAPHYTMLEMARALTSSRNYALNTQLNEDFTKALGILLTPDGRDKWDEFIARKAIGRPKNNIRSEKKKRFDNNRQAYKRICDPIVKGNDLIEFITEHGRLSEQVKPNDTLLPSTDSSGPNVSI